ncbi:MAG TPA: cytochrome c-type biogenesis protein CcmH [Terriglobales bacterium]|nr:cytochrome c-type biogenesis protein CcmH [Terriglobales bacterium]
MNKKIKLRTLQAAVLLLAATFLLGADSPDTRVNTLGHQMMCMCGCGQILSECNHVGCTYSSRQLAEVREMVLRGDNDAAIKDAAVQKYGTTVLAAPTTSGFNIVAWIMPFAIFGLALAAVVLVVRAWKRRTPATPVTAPTSESLDSYRELARKETEL